MNPMNPEPSRLVLSLLALASLHCSGTGGSGGAGGEGGTGGAIAFVEPRGACADEARVGRFFVEAREEQGVVQGAVADGVVPSSIPTVGLEEGDCRFLERRNLSCTPACVGSETCGEDGACVPYPRQLDVGSVEITGLFESLALEPQAPGNTYFAPDVANPPFDPGAEIVLFARGSVDVDAFALFGVGSPPLEGELTWTLEEGADLQVSWSAGATSRARVYLELGIDQHGASPVTLACSFDDSGAGVVPASVVDALIGAGVSGFPSGRLLRRTVDSVDTSVGCVDLVVGSPREASVSVAGFTPCDEPEDCPEGLVCDLEIELCE
jgi:hypothetical protein